MEPSVDLENLPFSIFYQCRMCTHLFFDDIEKVFAHFGERHGAMIDCEELKSLVYNNGLRLGPPPDEDDKTMIDEEDSVGEMVLPDDDSDSGKIEDFIGNGMYEESAYQGRNGKKGDVDREDMKYPVSVHDDEEQLAEGDYDGMMPEVVADVEVFYDSDDDTQTQEELENLPQDYNYEDGEYDECNEEGLLLDQSLNEDDLEGQAYEEDEQLEEGEEAENGLSSSDNFNQQNGILNYIGYSCKFCGKFFSTRRGVETHEQHHKNQTTPPRSRPNQGKRFPCKICKSVTFHSFKDLKNHVKTHTPERIHICKFCFSTFNNTASLTKHLTIHKRKNPNKCFCGKTFVSGNTLKIHKKIHTGIKPFVCSYLNCGRAFVTKSTLESHLRTHTGEKPYDCGFCSSSFTTSSAKYRHERHVHKAHGNPQEELNINLAM